MSTDNQILRPDYFAPAPTTIEATLRRIKGNYRRHFIRQTMEKDGPESVPLPWIAHNLSEMLKNVLGARCSAFRGGEDLPDLEEDEVEIARLTLVDSVHGEVTSLRAQSGRTDTGFRLRLVDEFGTAFTLSQEHFEEPLTAREVIEIFETADPNPTETSCTFAFQSFFHPELNEVGPLTS